MAPLDCRRNCNASTAPNNSAAAALRQGSQPEQAMDLDAALGNLPPVSRAVVWLHDVEGFTHKEIAGLMGRSESFSKSQLSRAYLRLRPMLDAQLEQENAATPMQGSVLGSC